MSFKRHAREDIINGIACQCGAAIGQPCLSPGGTPRRSVHRTRMNEYAGRWEGPQPASAAYKSAEAQRERREWLKQQGYHQMLLTLDPASISAVRKIHAVRGGSMNFIIRASLLMTCATLELAALPRSNP